MPTLVGIELSSKLHEMGITQKYYPHACIANFKKNIKIIRCTLIWKINITEKNLITRS